MPTYHIEIKEILVHSVEVTADSPEDAMTEAYETPRKDMETQCELFEVLAAVDKETGESFDCTNEEGNNQ